MSAAENFVDPVCNCINPARDWPKIDELGFPSLMYSFFSGMLTGIDFATGFLPPDPGNIPELPTIDMFIDPFMGTLVAPPLPEFSILGITIPSSGEWVIPELPDWDPINIALAVIDMIKMLIMLPFKIIEDIILGILDLEIRLPTLGGVTDLIYSIGGSLSIPTADLDIFSGCLAEGIMSTVDLLPV